MLGQLQSFNRNPISSTAFRFASFDVFHAAISRGLEVVPILKHLGAW
jgi:hypothetical protein